MVLDGQDHFVHAQAQVFGGRVDNALIGLVRHKPIDLIGGITGFFDNVICDFGQHFDGKLEYAGAVHADVGRTANLAVGNLSRDVQKVEVVAVGFEFAMDNARFVRCT